MLDFWCFVFFFSACAAAVSQGFAAAAVLDAAAVELAVAAPVSHGFAVTVVVETAAAAAAVGVA